MTHPRIKAVRPIRAKRIFARKYHITEDGKLYSHVQPKESVPVHVIYIEDTDALVEQVAQAITKKIGYDPHYLEHDTARSVLSSLGLLTPARRRKL